MTARPLPEARKKDLVEIKIPYEGHQSGASMAEEALKQARGWPERLDLNDPGIRKVRRKAGDYVVFTFRKAGG
jgi:hypothetical protein